MEWEFIEHHPSGLSSVHNMYYEGDVLNGKENGMGVRTNKIDQEKYTGNFNMGKREDPRATQIEVNQTSMSLQVYHGPFVNDLKHGSAEIIRDNVVYLTKYDRGYQKSIMTKEESKNGYCRVF